MVTSDIADKYKGIIDCFISVARDEGLFVFYRGMTPMVLKKIVGTGVVFSVYSFTKNILEIEDISDS